VVALVLVNPIESGSTVVILRHRGACLHGPQRLLRQSEYLDPCNWWFNRYRGLWQGQVLDHYVWQCLRAWRISGFFCRGYIWRNYSHRPSHPSRICMIPGETGMV
jgi:hypothetical protein